jgi:hypothetical protein
MGVNAVDFKQNLSRVTARGPSPNVWADCPILDIAEDPGIGIHLYEDWSRMPVLTTPTITTEAFYGSGWKAFGSAGGTVVSATIEGGGGLTLTETDDNQGIGLQLIALPFKISRSHGKFWMEWRLKTNTVSDTEHGFFVGLGDSMTLSATVPIAAAGTLADENIVGFHRLEGDGDQLDTVYKADGVTQVTLQSDVLDTTNTVAGALAADTYIKLGMVYDPSQDQAGSSRLSFYVNNVRLSTSYEMASGSGTDFPNDVQLAPLFAMLCASNNDAVVTLEWVRAAQLYV